MFRYTSLQKPSVGPVGPSASTSTYIYTCTCTCSIAWRNACAWACSFYMSRGVRNRTPRDLRSAWSFRLVLPSGLAEPRAWCLVAHPHLLRAGGAPGAPRIDAQAPVPVPFIPEVLSPGPPAPSSRGFSATRSESAPWRPRSAANPRAPIPSTTVSRHHSQRNPPKRYNPDSLYLATDCNCHPTTCFMVLKGKKWCCYWP